MPYRAYQLPYVAFRSRLTHAHPTASRSRSDGKVSLAEFNAALHPKTRQAIEKALDGGWTFDKAKWDASVERHAKWNMEKVFMQFDAVCSAQSLHQDTICTTAVAILALLQHRSPRCIVRRMATSLRDVSD